MDLAPTTEDSSQSLRRLCREHRFLTHSEWNRHRAIALVMLLAWLVVGWTYLTDAGLFGGESGDSVAVGVLVLVSSFYCVFHLPNSRELRELLERERGGTDE